MRKLFLFCSVFSFFPAFPQADAWEQLEFTGEPQARHENALVAVGDKLLLIGGRGEKKIDIYDINNQEWTTGAEPPLEVHHMQAVELDGLVYVLGGFTGSWPYETPLTHVLVYDLTEDFWAIGPEIPEGRRRGAAGAVVYNDKIYLVNGIINGHTSGWVNWLDEFDPYTNTWKELTNSPQARDHFQTAVIDEHLYVAGGRRSGSGQTGFSGTLKDAARYNFTTGKWEQIPDIPTERAGTASAVFNDKFVIIGGESDTQEAAHNEVEMYDPVRKKWEQLPALEKGRHGTQLVSLGNSLIIGAGSGNRGGGPELTSFEILSAEGKMDFQQLDLKPTQMAELIPSTKEISLRKQKNQTINITNTSRDKALFIPYLQLDNNRHFKLSLPRKVPMVIAPGESIPVRVVGLSRKKNIPPSNLFIKTLGNSEPIKVQISN